MANKKRSIDSKHRSVIQVALILLQIGMICSVLNFWDQGPCRCKETCTLHRRVNLLICQPYIFKLIRCRQLKWNRDPCCDALKWNQHFNLFKPEIAVFELTRCVKWTFCLFLSESTSLLSRFNQHFNLSRPEIDVFEVNALREMNSLLVLKLNQHPCCHALTWNQHFNPFRPKIAVFEFTRWVKWTACSFWSEINILAVMP